MGKLNIIQLIQKPQLRGAEIFACQLSNHLINQGNKVLLIAVFEGDAVLPYTGNIILLNRKIKNRFFDYSGWKIFHQIVMDFKPDIIQANAADTLKFAVSSKIFFNIKPPIVFRNANKIGDFINHPLKKILNSFYLSYVSFVASVSEECRRDFITTFKFPKEKVKTIPIGIDNRKFKGLDVQTQDLIKNKSVVVHVGSFVPEKNHMGLLRVFKHILKSQPNTILLLIGKGKLENSIKEEVVKLQLEDQVILLGYREDVLEILKMSHLLVLPSLIEGLPGVILEAMYCNVPVVAYNVGGIAEVISTATGTLVSKNDEKEFSLAMENTLRAPDKSKVEMAHQLVIDKFQNGSIARKFTRAYDRIV